MEETAKPSLTGSRLRRTLKVIFQGFIVICLVDGFLDISYPMVRYTKQKLAEELSRMRNMTDSGKEVTIPSPPVRQEPGIKGIPREYKSAHINIAPDGRRHNGEPPMPGSRKVILLGSSTAFGYGVKDSQTISSQLEQELEDVRVDNYAGIAQTTSSSVLRLYDLQKKYGRPDFAIMAGINYQLYEDCQATQPILIAEQRNIFHHLAKVAAARINRKTANQTVNQCASSDSADLAVRNSIVSVESAVSFARKMGSPFYIVYLPTPFDLNAKIDKLIASEHEREFVVNMQKVYTRYREELKKLDIPELVDLSEVLPPDQSYFIDMGGHLSAEGNKIVAKALAQHLRRVASSRSDRSFKATDVREPGTR
jgi:hypothetical protein